MNIYRVSCYSSCGSYFSSYLQFVTVMANSKEFAVLFTKEWLRKEGRSFISDDPKAWSVELQTSDVEEGVIDYHEDSDY